MSMYIVYVRCTYIQHVNHLGGMPDKLCVFPVEES